MDWFGVSHTETANSSSVKTAVEGDDGHLWYPRHLAHHGAGKFLRCEVNPASSHFLRIFHEHQLHGVLVAAGAAHHGDDVLRPGGSDPHQDVLQPVPPIVSGEDPQSRPVDERLHHLVPSGRGQQGRVVVPEGDAGDVGEDVQQLVAVNINNVIPNRGFVVNKELYGGHGLDLAQLLHSALGLGARDTADHSRSLGFQQLGLGGALSRRLKAPLSQQLQHSRAFTVQSHVGRDFRKINSFISETTFEL